uniref:Transcription factor Dp-1 n=1 Tax=Syphacia muris TaxID=451379 RepID=A0A0N5ARS5_9BILA
MDTHKTQGMMVQVVRGPSSTSAAQNYSEGSSLPGQRYIMSNVTFNVLSMKKAVHPVQKRVTVQSSQPNVVNRAMVVTPVQSRFTSGSRLGTHQTLSTPSYGIKRPFTHDYGSEFAAARKFPRSADKSKGLRHFSTKVCEKVKEKGQTNYNEVADELVTEYFDSLSHPPGDSEKQQYDMKNIRRRVYDALNVLMAMNIIEKEKKEIRWVGLPTSSLQECRRLEEEKAKRQDRLRRKAEQLQELIIQLVAYKTLVERNREREREEGRPAENSVLYLPYIVVNTEKKTMIDCAISHDKSEFLFNFNQPFEIHDDIEVLKRLGLAHGLEVANVPVDKRDRVKSFLPPALRDYVDQILEGMLYFLFLLRCFVVSGVSNAGYGASSSVVRVGSSPSNFPGASRSYVTTGVSYGAARVPQTRYTVLPRHSISSVPPSHFVPAVSTYRSAPTTTATRQYVVQQNGSVQQRSYAVSRQAPVAYTIQSPGQVQHIQGQRFEEIYEDEEENVRYE